MNDKFCSKCGAYIRPGAAFCPECGMKITANNTLEFSDEKPKKKKFPLWLLLIVIPAIIIWIIFAYLTIQRTASGNKEPEIITYDVEASQPQANEVPSEASAGSGQPEEISQPAAAPEATAETILEVYPDGDPEYEDFDWYYSDVKVNGIPEGAVRMEPSDLNGSWKYMFRFEITGNAVSYMEEIGYVNISQYAGKIDLSPWPLYMKDGYGNIEKENAEEIGYEPFVGTVDENGIHLTGNGCAAEISAYYQYHGVQYAIGSMVTRYGYITDILLVRP